MPHYTSTNQEALVERVTSDFIGQIAQRLEVSDTPQIELAKKLGKSESEVSQVLNLNRINLTLKTMVGYARALGMKVAVIAYDDGDPTNENGPVGSEIFTLSWEKSGKQRDIWSLNQVSYSTSTTERLYWIHGWMCGSITSTFGGGAFNTSNELSYIPKFQPQKATLTHGGS
jgi:hypothetical protein